MTGWIDALYRRILLAAHPVGSIYQSTDATSPATLFGGTWVAIEGQFLLAAGGSYTAGSTGGEAVHKLVASELPKLTGQIYAGSGATGESSGGYGAIRTASGICSAVTAMQYGRPNDGYCISWPSNAPAYSYVNIAFGGDGAHNNMPPYMAVYMWRRTA